MDFDRSNDTLPPEVDVYLDGLIESWAAPRRLSASRSARIRKAVLQEALTDPLDALLLSDSDPLGQLDWNWWYDLMGQVAIVAVAANSDTCGIAAGLSTTFGRLPFAMEGIGVSAYQQEDYRPYLRL